MTDIYDHYGDDTFETLQKQLEGLSDHELYADIFADADVDPAAVDSWAQFRELPFTSTEDLLDDIDANPPTGSLHEPGSMISFTPARDRELPVYETPADIERYAEVHEEVFRRLELEPGMRAMVVLKYQGFGTGYLVHRILEEYGIEVIPAGPGESEQRAERIEEFDVDLLWGNPSFALEIAEHGGQSLDYFVGGGEPFTSIPGRREQVHEAFDGLEWAVDNFGLRQAWPVAIESAEEDGLHVVDDYMLVEIIDPETGEPLGLDERGEVVITHLDRDASPLCRYRTGDLSMLSVTESRYTDEPVLTMPRGVFGRTDEMHKVKGVKLYSEGVALVLAGFPDLSLEYRIRITRPNNTDHLTVVCEGEADREELENELTAQLGIRPDEIELVDELEDGPTVVDERY